MRILYVKEQGSLIRKTSERIIVEKDNTKLLDIPAIKLDSLVLFGNIQLSTQVMKFFLARGIDVVFMNMKGEHIGSLQAPRSGNVILRIQQYAVATQDTQRLQLAKAIVSGKLSNMKMLLQQGIKNYRTEAFTLAVRELQYCQKCLIRKNAIPSLLGIEGHATALYYRNFPFLLRSSELRFGGRTRRPPRDPVNALLSFSYAVFGNELTSAIEAAGFDPYIGIYHGIQYGRKSLALDMLEEFRPFCDRFVIRLVNLGCLKTKDFTVRENGGFYLHPDAMRTYFEQYEAYMAMLHDGDPMRKIIQTQVLKMKKSIVTGTDYLPWEMR